MSRGSDKSDTDPWFAEAWPAAHFAEPPSAPPHAVASKGATNKTYCPAVGHPQQPPPQHDYFFDSFKVIPELLVERLHQEYSANLHNPGVQQDFFALKHEPLEKKYFELKPSASNLNQQLGFYSEHQLQQFISGSQLGGKGEGKGLSVVKEEMNSVSLGSMTGPFVYQPFLFSPGGGGGSGAYKCGCDPKGNHHFLCPNSARPDTMNEASKHSDSGSSTASLERPQNIRSDKERPFSCDECAKSFLLKHHLVTHSKVHTGLRPHGCLECGKTFTHKHCLTTHQRLHSGLRPYQCPECKKSFTLKHHLVTHQRTHSKERPFRCDSCGKTFGQKRNLNMHLKLHSGERPFQCPVCDECFVQQDQLVVHSRFHGGNNAFVCADCGSSFARKFELVDHRRSHGHSPYACTTCGKEFLQKRTLQQHSKLHDGSKPYICKYCNECFGRMVELIAHAKIHTCFTCKECGQGFGTQELLIVHLQQHGRVVLPQPPPPKTPPPKKHLCPQCGAGFAQKHGLSQHVTRKHKPKPPQIDPFQPVAPDGGHGINQIKNQVLLAEQLRAKLH